MVAGKAKRLAQARYLGLAALKTEGKPMVNMGALAYDISWEELYGKAIAEREKPKKLTRKEKKAMTSEYDELAKLSEGFDG